MKAPLLLMAVTLFLFSCKKDYEQAYVTGTVSSKAGPGADTYLVVIDDADTKSYSFLCKTTPFPPPGSANCNNGVYITNLPADLRVTGTAISFSKFKNLGRNMIWSSTYAPNDLEVYDAKKR